MICLVSLPSSTISLKPLLRAQELLQLTLHPPLLRLNSGIFILHAILTATFVALPITLQNSAGLNASQQWLIYLPTLLCAFICTIPLIVIAEKKSLLKQFFIICILLIATAELLLFSFSSTLWVCALSLFLFFTGFSVLEAFLPSLTSKTAPQENKGAALGIYSCSQFLGIFVGGLAGGLLYGSFGLPQVYLFCVILTFFWLTITQQLTSPSPIKGKS